MRIETFLTPDRTLVLEAVKDRDDVLRSIAETAASSTPGVQAEVVYDALCKREEQMPTSTPEGVGFPHALGEAYEKTLLIAALLRPGVSFGVEQHPPVDLVMAMVGSSNEPWEHVRLLARLARIARGEGALTRLRNARDPAHLFEMILEEDRAYV